MISFLSFIFMYARCKKDVPLPLPTCSGNCTSLVFSGNVLNAAYNTGIRNAQIKITTPGGYGSLADTTYTVGMVSTDVNGNFRIVTSIDTTVHKVFYDTTTMPPGYLVSTLTPVQYSFVRDYTQSKSFYVIDSNLQHIQFEAFPITKLAINLHRNTALSTNYPLFYATYSVVSGGAYTFGESGTEFIATSKNTDTTIYVETSPVLHTIIKWYAYIDTGSSYANGVDSISCQPNTTSQIYITY